MDKTESIHFAPALELGHRHVGNANIDKIDNLIKESDFSPEIPQYISYDEYKSNGGYSLYKNIKEGIISFEKFHKAISDANLRGLGGAGFPAAKKWEFVIANKGPRMM